MIKYKGVNYYQAHPEVGKHFQVEDDPLVVSKLIGVSSRRVCLMEKIIPLDYDGERHLVRLENMEDLQEFLM